MFCHFASEAYPLSNTGVPFPMHLYVFLAALEAACMHFCLLWCPWGAGCIHFYMLQRAWGGIFYAFLLALAPLRQYLLYFLPAPLRPWGSIVYAFLLVPAPLEQHLLCIFICSGAPRATSSVHFFLLWHPWGSFFCAFSHALALLRQHLA